ncbi:MAG: hypothetical protein QXY19_05485 [Archaeoglobaceae archaeon]
MVEKIRDKRVLEEVMGALRPINVEEIVGSVVEMYRGRSRIQIGCSGSLR